MEALPTGTVQSTLAASGPVHGRYGCRPANPGRSRGAAGMAVPDGVTHAVSPMLRTAR